MERKYRDKEWLHQKYVSDGYSTIDIAGEFGVEPSTITYWLQKHGLTEINYDDSKLYNDKSWLTQQYRGNGLTCKEISELPECDISESAIQHRISKFGIAESSDESRYKRLSIERGVPSDSKHLDPEWMYKKYVEEKLTIREISEHDSVYVSPSSVNRALHKFGIDSRPSLSVPGEDNPWYKHGNSYGDYGENWDSIRKNIRKRDEFRCQRCDISQREHLHLFNIRLDVHHIKPREKFDNIENANKSDNLITLCRSCHMKVENGSAELDL